MLMVVSGLRVCASTIVTVPSQLLPTVMTSRLAVEVAAYDALGPVGTTRTPTATATNADAETPRTDRGRMMLLCSAGLDRDGDRGRSGGHDLDAAGVGITDDLAAVDRDRVPVRVVQRADEDHRRRIDRQRLVVVAERAGVVVERQRLRDAGRRLRVGAHELAKLVLLHRAQVRVVREQALGGVGGGGVVPPLVGPLHPA